jgi:phage tail sheath protein FI
MSFNVGINVLEVDGRAAPSIQAAPTSQTGFVVRTDRGLPNAVRRITSFKQFTESFGGFRADSNGAYALRGFFENGGSVAYVTRVVRTSGTGAAATSTLTFDDASDNASLAVTAGFRGQDDPGAWGDRVGIRIAPNPVVSGTFDLFIRLDGRDVETWEQLNIAAGGGNPGRNPETLINDEITGSRYIHVDIDGSAAANPDDTSGHSDADADGFVNLDAGADDSISAGALPGELAAAFSRFDTLDIQLLCCPESSTSTVVTGGLSYCAGRGDCMYIGHTPEGNDVSAARTYGQGFQAEKAYGALYFPWVRVADPIGTQRWVPPTGHIAGVYARTERERGIWKAPAGNAAQIRGALDVDQHITDVDHTDLVKNGSVNAVRFISGRGIVVDSSRTLSTSPLWLYVNVRLLFNFVKSSLKDGLRWVVQEPNDDRLWNKVKYNTIRPFLLGLWRRGAFGPGSPDEVFTVKIDEENNTPANIQQGIFTAEVYFYPSRPAETVIITVGQQEGAGSANEA